MTASKCYSCGRARASPLKIAALIATAVLMGAVFHEPASAEANASQDAAADRWRTVDPNNLLVIQLPQGRVLIELAEDFAPRTLANFRRLIRSDYFAKAAINRVDHYYVAQWAAIDPQENAYAAKPIAPEFTVPIAGRHIRPLPDGDVYAPAVGFYRSWPVAFDPIGGQMWLPHCYGMVGVGRNNDPTSGNGRAPYIVISTPPRELDRNVTLVGRVLEGMELIGALKRGAGPMGSIAAANDRTPILAIKVARDLPRNARPHVEVLDTDSDAFDRALDRQRSPESAWFVEGSAKIDICRVTIHVRVNG